MSYRDKSMPAADDNHFSDHFIRAGASRLEQLPPICVTYMIDHLFNVQAGGELALFRILRHLPRDRFRPSVVTFNVKPQTRDLLYRLECPLHVFPICRTYGWSGLKAALAIRHLFRVQKPDIVHTFFETSNTWGGLITKLSFGPALVSSRRDMGLLRSSKHGIAYRVVNRLADRVQSVSHEVTRMCIEREGIAPQKVFTIYNGVDLAKTDLANTAESFQSTPELHCASHVVTTVANIRRVKGLTTFIKAAALVRRNIPSVLFVIAGQTNEKLFFQELQLLVKNLNLEHNVRFLGVVDDVFPLLKRTNVFCLLSRSEGFSNALLEAMACGLPCVATRVGGNPEAISDGENGYLVPYNDVALTANRIMALLEAPEHAHRLGQQARKTVEAKFTIDRMIEQLTRFYEDLIRPRVAVHAGHHILDSPV
jgi:glycosyltransferase involved in cell wall biosynthesis